MQVSAVVRHRIIVLAERDFSCHNSSQHTRLLLGLYKGSLFCNDIDHNSGISRESLSQDNATLAFHESMLIAYHTREGLGLGLAVVVGQTIV
jgi:hypothetical protein